MKKFTFLVKLKKQNKIERIDPSIEMQQSYIEKSANSLKAAQALLPLDLLPESISMAYYAMYHSLLALFFRCGIKCENHAGNILLLNYLFENSELYILISKAKEERIDKQYYVDFEVSKKDAEELISKAQQFITEIKIHIEKLTNEEIEQIQRKVEDLH